MLDWGLRDVCVCGLPHRSGDSARSSRPNAIRDQDVSTGWFVEAGSLEDWLETWLDGRGWYEEGTSAGPAKDRWAEASERLWPGVVTVAWGSHRGGCVLPTDR